MKILIIFLIIIILLLSIFTNVNYINNKFTRTIITWPLIITLGIIFGWRPLEDFTDTYNYTVFFYNYKNHTLLNALEVTPMEKGYTTFQWIISQYTNSYSIFLFLVFILSILLIVLCYRKIFFENYLFAMFAFIFSPLFDGLYGNIIRTGIAFGFFMLGSIYIFQHKKIRGSLLLLISSTFHITLLPFTIVLILINIKKYGFIFYIVIWFISSILFLTKSQLKLLPILTKLDKIDYYAGATAFQSYGNSGMRLDFFLFNLFLIVILFIGNKYIFEFKNEIINYYLKLTLIASIVFHFLGFIAFSDRVALYVWHFFLVTFLVMVIEINKKYIIILPLYLLFSILIGIAFKSYIFFH
ncbi:EpsG family protein [Psychrobacillus sp. FSL K6-1464]|uniref:EpsG family protein n=1 Tax=Psychrobacillus sp. FSL K6-1464 TaxID=2921545 RepID=UPI0030F4FA63